MRRVQGQGDDGQGLLAASVHRPLQRVHGFVRLRARFPGCGDTGRAVGTGPGGMSAHQPRHSDGGGCQRIDAPRRRSDAGRSQGHGDPPGKEHHRRQCGLRYPGLSALSCPAPRPPRRGTRDGVHDGRAGIRREGANAGVQEWSRGRGSNPRLRICSPPHSHCGTSTHGSRLFEPIYSLSWSAQVPDFEIWHPD